MFKSLPVEISVYIISFLSLSEKATCLLVNREWHDTIKENILYIEIPLLGSQVDSLFGQLEKKGFPVTYSKLLDIQKYDYSVKRLKRVLNLFPSLKQLMWEAQDRPENEWKELEEDEKEEEEELEITAAEVLPWSKYLSTLNIIGGGGTLWFSILGLGIFHHLTHLTLIRKQTRVTEVGVDRIQLDQSPLLNALSFHVPFIEYLHLGDFRIHIKAMETLHQHAKHLNTLLLESVVFSEPEPEPESEPEQGSELETDHDEIDPATQLIRFEILGKHNRIDGERLLWLDYISKKYSHIHEFSIDLHVPFSDHQDTQHIPVNQINGSVTRYEAVLLKLLDGMKPGQLKSLRLKNKPVSPIIFEKLQDMNIQLRSLEFGHPFRNRHIQSSLNALFSSTQTLSLEELGINFISEACHISLYELGQLKSLKLYYDWEDFSNTTNLDALMIPLTTSLESLFVDSKTVSCDYSYLTPKPPQFPLRKLHLHTRGLYFRVFGFINDCLPDLQHLTLQFKEIRSSYFKQDSPEMVIYLPKHNFDYLEIATSVDQLYPCKVVTEKETYWYLVDPVHTERIYKDIFITEEEVKEKMTSPYYFKVQCKSIKKMVFKVK